MNSNNLIKKNLSRGYKLKNRYEIVSSIKKGGMSKVYLAKDGNLNSLCAVKELFVHLMYTGEEQKHIIRRFREEAEFLAKLFHPALPRVTDYFGEDVFYYIIMEYIIGNDLEALVKEKGNPGLPEIDVVRWSIKICDVLEHLHKQEPPIIYSDLKPSNLMVRDKDSEILVVDFGSARVLPPNKERLTGIGTEGYAPPEQYIGAQDSRSDIYSLGATIHHLLTGRPPDIPFEFPPVRSFVTSLSPRIEQAVIKTLKKDKNKRYQSVEELRKELSDHLNQLAVSKNQTVSISSFIKSRTEAIKKNFLSLMNIMKKPPEEEKTKIFLMIVDDEDTLRETFIEVFSLFQDIQVIETASNGAEAVRKFKSLKVKPDIILMDVYMPEMDGITATEEITRLNTSTKVVMLTALSNQETVLKAFNAGAAGYIIKGTRMEYLAQVVREAYGGGSPIGPEISKILLKEFFPSKIKMEMKEKLDIIKDTGEKTINLEDGRFSDIVAEMSMAKFSGMLRLTRASQEGNVYFNKGEIVRAELRNLKDENAIYSFPLWSEATIKFEMGLEDIQKTVKEATEDIVIKSLNVWEEWIKLKEILGSTGTIFKVAFTKHYEVVSLSNKELEVLSQLNGYASIAEVAHNLNKSYFETAEIIYQLSLLGIVERIE